MRQKGVLLLALILAVVAVVLVQLYLHQLKAERKTKDMVSVLVVAKDVPAGSALLGTQVTSQMIPKQYLNPNAVLPKDLDLILGMTTANDLRKGQQILWTDFITEPEEGLAGIISHGERALTLDVTMRTGVAGLLRPNDHVDIIGTFRTPREVKVSKQDLLNFNQDFSYQYEQVTVTLLQNVTILAVGDIIGSKEATSSLIPDVNMSEEPPAGMNVPVYNPAKAMNNMYRTVTVLVTPLEAELLTHAVATGEITLALRNPEDMITELALPNIKFTDVVKPEFLNDIQEKRTKAMKDKIDIIRGPGSKRKKTRP
ncbi:Flp pilus assembly protein CpaB [bacterium]|nr:Flp pilus assembly protein CpaB [candidate division CSSED10-310 bacterium]